MSGITTHVLDTARGRPAADIAVVAAISRPDGWETVATGRTNPDGRVSDFLPAGTVLEEGVYRLTFAVGSYFEEQDAEAFYPAVEVTFRIRDPGQHYHVPLLLSPFGYSTYRGS